VNKIAALDKTAKIKLKRQKMRSLLEHGNLVSSYAKRMLKHLKSKTWLKISLKVKLIKPVLIKR
jgi:hypothetical protein